MNHIDSTGSPSALIPDRGGVGGVGGWGMGVSGVHHQPPPLHDVQVISFLFIVSI